MKNPQKKSEKASVVFVVVSLVLFLLPLSAAHAFPEMVRHGYTHCTACHTTLVGGGLLNEYGRSLSRELLSQTSLLGQPSVEGDEAFFSGVVKPPSWLLAQGDFRVLQTFVESDQTSRARFFFMQVALEASAKLNERLRLFASVDRWESHKTDAKFKDFVISQRHGIEYVFTPAEAEQRFSVRAGRFMPAYGIGFAEHPFVTRQMLDFMPGQERVAAEFAWSNDHSSAIATAIGAQANGAEILNETGGIAQLATAVHEHSKVGVNYYHTRRVRNHQSSNRRIYGVFAHLDLAKDWYGLLEVDRPQAANGKWGAIEIFKLGHEIHQGLQVFAAQEFANLDTEHSNPRYEAYSLGSEWFPRPHWDLLGVYRLERNSAASGKFQNVVWLIGHYYL